MFIWRYAPALVVPRREVSALLHVAVIEYNVYLEEKSNECVSYENKRNDWYTHLSSVASS